MLARHREDGRLFLYVFFRDSCLLPRPSYSTFSETCSLILVVRDRTFSLPLSLSLSLSLFLSLSPGQAAQCGKVVAVDPAAMKLNALSAEDRSRVKHYQLKAGEAAPLLLRDEKERTFDLLTCDANVSPCVVVKEMVAPLLPLMKRRVPSSTSSSSSSSWLVLTLKNTVSFGMQSEHWRREVESAKAMLEELGAHVVEVRQLMTNRREETLVASY